MNKPCPNTVPVSAYSVHDHALEVLTAALASVMAEGNSSDDGVPQDRVKPEVPR